MSDKKVSLFDFLTDLNSGKQYLYSEVTKKEFVTFMINRGMSQQWDTILLANEMNKNWHIDKELVHDFYFYLVSKRKRYGKWAKGSDDRKDDIELVVRHYNVSKPKAIEYLKLLSDDDLKVIKAQYDVGGKK